MNEKLPEGWERVPRGWMKQFPADADGRYAWAVVEDLRGRPWEYHCLRYSTIASHMVTAQHTPWKPYRLAADAIAAVEQKHAELEAAKRRVTSE